MSEVKEPRRVVIVRDVSSEPILEASRDSLDMLIRTIMGKIERNSQRGDAQHRAPATVEVVEAGQLAGLLRTSTSDNMLIIFMTARALDEARRIKDRYKRHTVVVCSSDFPADEVLLVNKFTLGSEHLRDLVRYA